MAWRAAVIFGKCPNICVITFNLQFSTYMLPQWRFMLYFNVIILVPCPSHLRYCLAIWKNIHNGRTWFLYDLLWETTCLERPFLLGRRGGRPRQVLLYTQLTIWRSISQLQHASLKKRLWFIDNNLHVDLALFCLFLFWRLLRFACSILNYFVFWLIQYLQKNEREMSKRHVGIIMIIIYR